MKRDDFGLYRDYGLYIDGRWRPATDGAVREVLDPANEEVLGWIPAAGKDDLDAALACAQRGLALWRRTSPWERAAILNRSAELIREPTGRHRPADDHRNRQAAGAIQGRDLGCGRSVRLVCR